MKKRVLIPCMVVVLFVAAWATYQGLAQQPRESLARLMPADAVLFLEAQDLGGLLKEWSVSPERKAWLGSDNYEVFSRSRLFLRLQQAQEQFAAAAGIPPNMSFLNEVAGEQSALGIYDIGNLEVLYVTRLSSSRAVNSGIWQQRSKFETRQVAGKTFYVRTDPESERVVAFAADDDYLILGTREDLVAGALSLLANEKAAKLSEQGWFVDALKTAKDAGELRMVIHLADVTKTPQFRTYWIPQNITEMRQYESSVTDLFRSADTYREERTLLMKNAPESSDVEMATQVAGLVRLVPPGLGFYRAKMVSSVDDAVAMLEEKVLTPRLGPAPVSKLAPNVQLGEQTVGSESNLDTRIDIPPSTKPEEKASDDELKALLKNAEVRAALQLHRSEAADDGVFVRLYSTVVLQAASDWNERTVQLAIQRLITPGLTAGDLGASWKKSGTGSNSYSELDGFARVAVAVRGRYLFVSNDPETLTAVLGRMDQPVSVEPALYYAAFDHSRERQNFYQLTSLIDRPSRANNNDEPQFFSQDVTSLSRTFGGLKSQSIVARRDGAIEKQTVIYQWAQ